MRLLSALAGCLLLAVTALPGIAIAASANGSGNTEPRYDHAFVIVEENHEFDQIIGNANAPTINKLAQTYGLASQYFGVTHPSEPNYVAMVGANFYGIADDAPYSTHQISNPSLVDQLEGAGLTWKGYFQSMPAAGFTGTCFPSSSNCLYASKHNGFVNFTHVSSSPSEMAELVPDTQLGRDLASNPPSFAFIAPDQCHDMHGLSACPNEATNISVADTYLQDTVNAIMNAPFWKNGHNAIVINFDEGDTNLGCCDANPGGGRMVTIVINNHAPSGVQDATPYNHYSLVATVEKVFGLSCLQFTCDRANVKSMDPLFQDHPSH